MAEDATPLGTAALIGWAVAPGIGATIAANTGAPAAVAFVPEREGGQLVVSVRF